MILSAFAWSQFKSRKQLIEQSCRRGSVKQSCVHLPNRNPYSRLNVEQAADWMHEEILLSLSLIAAILRLQRNLCIE